MTTDSAERDPVEALAAEFIERCRRGESPSVEDYAQKYPALAAAIRDLFPTISAMENLKADKSPPRLQAAAPGGKKLERLGDFRIIREIGRGGMGIVYEAEQESLGRSVAVKVLPNPALLDEKKLRRFQREARTAARLHHTNIVPVFGVGEQDGLHYYVMQLIRGVGLDQALSSGTLPDVARARAHRNGQATEILERPPTESMPHNGSMPSLPELSVAGPATCQDDTQDQNGALDPPRKKKNSPPAPRSPAYWKSVAEVAKQVAQALAYAHAQNILHRDIKPANLLLDATGNVWVADFGLAKALEQDDVSNAGDVVGTLQYMAPELFHGKYDARSDLCSLGLTLYELLTLRPAYEDTNRFGLFRKITQEEPPPPRHINPAMPRDLETIVLKAIARDPDRRYQTAKEFAADLQRFLDDRPVRARPIGAVERLGRWCRRNPAVACLSALALFLLVLVAVVGTVGYVRTSAALEGERLEHQNAINAQNEESLQRKKAEATSMLALEVLDQIFEELAPDRIVAASELTIEAAGGEEIEVSLQPTLSPETAALLEKMLDFYSRLADQGTNDAKLRHKAAKANRRVGDIQLRLGQPEQALKAYQHAAEIYKVLADEFPGDISRVAELAAVYNALGQAYLKNNQQEKAKQSHQYAVQILVAVSLTNGSSAKISYELARTYYSLGKGPFFKLAPALPPGPKFPGGPAATNPPGTLPAKAPGVPETPKFFTQAIQLLNILVHDYPASPAYRQLLALCYREKSVRNAGAGGKDRKEAIRLLEQLVEDFPKVPDYRFDLSETLAQTAFGFPTKTNKDVNKDAEKDLEKALSLTRDLVAEHPNVPDYQIAKSQIHLKLGELHQHKKHLLEAEDDFRAALKLHNALVQRYPKVLFHQLFRARIQDLLAGVLITQNFKWQESRSLLESSIKQLIQITGQDEKMGFLKYTLAERYDKLAKVLEKLEEPALAKQAAAQAKKLRPPFKGPFGAPKNPGGK